MTLGIDTGNALTGLPFGRDKRPRGEKRNSFGFVRDAASSHDALIFTARRVGMGTPAMTHFDIVDKVTERRMSTSGT